MDSTIAAKSSAKYAINNIALSELPTEPYPMRPVTSVHSSTLSNYLMPQYYYFQSAPEILVCQNFEDTSAEFVRSISLDLSKQVDMKNIASTVYKSLESLCLESLRPANTNSEMEIKNSFKFAAKIKSFLTYPKGWDGGNAEPITTKTANEGLSFIELINMDGILPHVSPAADGELAFVWKNGDSYLEVSFYGEEEIYWYCRKGTLKSTGSQQFSGKSISRELDQMILDISKID